ncbi:MAG: alpha/beta fold hydrolase [Candidatus Rokuibacteriota bacterium]
MGSRPLETAEATVARIEAGAARRLTPCGDGAMVWRSWGRGRPLVLLHGASGSWTHWIRNVEALAARLRVLAPDMPGFGDSDTAPPPATAETLADIVSAGLDILLPPPVPIDLAGFSFGGIIAGLVAARQGARVRTLALIGPNGMALPSRPTRPLVRIEPHMSLHETAAAHRENLRILMIARSENADDLAVHVQMENVRRTRFKSGAIPASDTLLRTLPAVKARLAGIWGGADVFAVPYIDARRRALSAIQHDLDFRVVPGAGHWVPYEAAEEVNRALLETLAGV